MALQNPSPARAATRVLRLAALSLSLTAAFGASAPAAAQSVQQAGAHDYRIPAGPLDQALSAFAKAGGITVSFRPEDTGGLTTQGLNGSYAVDAGLAKLLAGTGLAAEAQGGQGYVVRAAVSAAKPSAQAAELAASASTLESIQVSGDWLGTGLENSVQTFGGARTLLRRDEIQNSGATSVADALRRVPGVQISGSTSATGSSVGLHVGIRGLNPRNSFRTTMLLDGIPMAMAPYGQPNLVMSPTSLGNIEAIDVVRGGGAVRYGPQNVGGVINFKTRAIPNTSGLTAEASARYNIFSHGGANTQYTGFLGTQFDNGLGVALMYSGMDGEQWRDGSDDRYNDVALKWRFALTPTSEI